MVKSLYLKWNQQNLQKNITIVSDNNLNHFKCSGSTIKFDGFLKLSKLSEDEDEKILPDVKKEVKINEFIDEQHFTQPPPRFSEASLVKKLEELGIVDPQLTQVLFL